MLRLLSSLLVALALVFGLTAHASAQADLGNDGIDMDCGDFVERNAAQGYFVSDGGTADRNVDRLDADGDGQACEANDQANENTADGEDEEDDNGTTLPETGAGVTSGGNSVALTLGLLVASSIFGLAALRTRRA